MKAKNFRIGNFVKARTTDNEFDVIKEIGFSDNQRDYYLRLENINHGVWLEHNGESLILGIPITEEWLTKFGFKDISNSVEQRFIKNQFNWYSSSGEIVVELDNGLNGYDLWTDCKHVHELQNLFFAITGEELQFENVSQPCT